jgi:predicted glutamine amidotransferase
MCGLWGISYGPGGPQAEMWPPEDLMQIFFPATVHRGRHAWGYMTYSAPEDGSAGGIKYFRKSGSASHKDAPGDMIVDEPTRLRWMAGHVRYATTGSPKILGNNHPMIHDRVIGMHNGVLRDYYSILKETGRSDPKVTVDSEAIFAAINKWGLKAGLKRIKGDMVTVFADTQNPDAIYIARSHGRPLWYATTEAGSFVWASEKTILNSAGLLWKTHPRELTRTNVIMRIVGGEVSYIKQYADADPTADRPSWSQPASTVRTGASTGSSSSSSRFSGFGAGMYQEDEFGGKYVGGNQWRVKDEKGVLVSMSADQYIRFQVERQVAVRLEAEVRRVMMNKLHAATKFFPGKHANSKPAEGELTLVPPLVEPTVSEPATTTGHELVPVRVSV